MNRYDVLIIGGGASGLCCAISAKQKHPDSKIAIIEKNDRVGKKLLSTGNGRCNLTHKDISAEKYIGSFKEQSRSVFKKYDTDKLLKFFSSIGLICAADSEGRYYPVSRHASSVLDVLRFACERLGINIFCGEAIRKLSKSDAEFSVITANQTFYAYKLVIACGSKAAPKLGGSASGADYLRNLGHTVIPFSPALCPVSVNSEIINTVKGLRAQGKVSLLRAGKIVKEDTGEIQFADNALSGICIFNLSLYTKQGDTIKIDFLNNISYNELFDILNKNKLLYSSLPTENLFTGILQKRLSLAVLKQSGGIDIHKSCAALTKEELKKISDAAKNLRFEVKANAGFEQAQAALGGVTGREIDENTMRSKRVKNLYVCGEAVDICGECGGYNLHFAFTSGIIAGENI